MTRGITTLRPPTPATALRRTVLSSLDPYRATPLALARALARKHRLTPTEAEVLHAFVGGARRSELAAAIGISDNTMRSHVRSVCRKMDIAHLEQVHRLMLKECIGWLAECELRHMLTRMSG